VVNIFPIDCGNVLTSASVSDCEKFHDVFSVVVEKEEQNRSSKTMVMMRSLAASLIV
jgi:hypothetical protein